MLDAESLYCIIKVMLTIIILISVAVFGAYLRRRNIVSENAKQILFQYVYYIATPAAVIHALITHQLSSYSQYGKFLLVNAACYFLVFLALYKYMKTRKFNYKAAGVIAYSANTPNSVFLGFPLILALFHNGTFIYAVLLGTLMDAVLNFFRIFLLERYKKKSTSSRNKNKKFLLIIKSIINPFLISLVIGLGFVYLKFMPAENVLKGLGYLGKSASYAALFVLGLSVGKLKIVKKDKEELAVITFVKLFAMPLIVLVASTMFGLSKSAVNAGVFISALPTAIFSLVVAANLKLDQRLASSAILITTIVSVVTLPIWYFILRTIN